MSKDLGKVLRALRDNCGLTQRQMADALHIERSTYTYYELGDTEPDLKTINKIAKILNVDVDMILPDDDGKPALLVEDITAERKAMKKSRKISTEMSDPKIYELSKFEKGVLAHLRALPEAKRNELLAMLGPVD